MRRSSNVRDKASLSILCFQCHSASPTARFSQHSSPANMSAENISDVFGANCSLAQNYSSVSASGEIISDEDCLPAELREISESSLKCVIAYCIVFVIAATGNLLTLTSLWKKFKTTESRISLLFLHLAIADLIVCCTLIPTEVFWRLTIQWRGGNVLCKVTQFLRAFGLYLSSLVLICVSFDRFLAIMLPMSMLKAEAYQRIKKAIYAAWITAAVFSAPQAIYFGIESHPQFPSFKQCVTNNFLDNSRDVEIYSIFSVAVMYFVPLVVIILTYGAIIIKLVRKSGERSRSGVHPEDNSDITAGFQNESKTTTAAKQSPRASPVVQLRCSGNAEAALNKAKSRTLWMTVVIVLGFVVCWTPYAVMTLWYMVDWKGAEQVDPRIQDAFFLMAVANSSINPLIYGSFNYRSKAKGRRNFC